MTERDPLAVLARTAPVRDEDLSGCESSAAARELLEDLLTREAPRARRRFRLARPSRLALAGCAVAATLAVAVLPAGSPLETEPAAAGVSFTTRDGFVIAEVSDPHAAAAQLRAAFAAHDLDVELELVPASPSLVGTVVMVGAGGTGTIESLQSGRCVAPAGGCPVGLRIPVGFRGHAEITLARAAEPGERFRSSGDAFAPGEPLHCSGLRGMRVADAQRIVERRGLRATWRLHDDAAVAPASAAGHFVADATPIAAGEILIGITGEPPEPLSPAYERDRDAGC